MSTLSQIGHSLADLLEGRASFNDVIASDGKLIEEQIAKAPALVQPALEGVYASFRRGLSSAVGVGETALGHVLSESNDTLATHLLNLMSAAGIPTNGVLSVAEHAALVQLISGLKTTLDRLHITYGTPHGLPAATIATPPSTHS